MNKTAFSKRAGRFLTVSFAGTLLWTAPSGCMTSKPVPNQMSALRRPPLVVSRSGEMATIQWQTKPGWEYSVIYSDSRARGAEWKTLPGCEKVQGSGAPVTFVDKLPYSKPRYYKLRSNAPDQ